MTIRRTPFPSKKATLTRIRAYLPIVLSLLMLMPVLVRHAAAQDQVPTTIAYQGYLTNADGDPANGSAGIVFSLYDDDADGARLWQETQQGVVFIDGVFSVHLGAVVSLEAVSFDRPLWLGVAVAGGAELRPRVALEAVPYALSVRGLRVESVVDPDDGFTLTMIGGHPANEVGDGILGATISGGGLENFHNQIDGSLGTIGGGGGNVITGPFATIGGGSGNEANEYFATVGGGSSNTVNGVSATIGGGQGNTAGPRATIGGGGENTASGLSATVGGGSSNTASGEQAAIGGGGSNTASGERATIGGGNSNVASGARATVAGGGSNRVSGDDATVGGGIANMAGDQWATVSGGNGNDALAQSTVVAGGDNNVAEGSRATIGGGGFNAAQGVSATVPGGEGNWANGDRSFAAGFQARTEHDGAFVWADYFSITDPPFVSTAARQFLIRARGGVGIGTNAPQGTLHVTERDLGIAEASGDVLVVEGTRPVIGIYGSFQANTRPGLVLAGVNENGTVVDKWGIVREYFGTNRLHFTYGLDADHTQNATAMSLSPNGPTARTFTATNDLGSNGTPTPGGHFRDNVVYAWAHVRSDGSVTASYGCTVTKITGTGRYRVTFKRQLSNGASAVVTVQTLNDPVIATAVTNANQADVATKVFNGAAFVAADYGFYIQVVGRP